MQLIAGRTAQEYNQRRATQGAFWEDRYHATAIEIDEHLYRCVVYIDLNMVRAGVVNHPVRRDTVVRPVDNSRKRREPLPAARLVWPRPSIHLLIPQDQIHSRDNVGRLRNHLARQSLELVAPHGVGFSAALFCFQPPKLHAVIEDLPLGAQVGKGF